MWNKIKSIFNKAKRVFGNNYKQLHSDIQEAKILLKQIDCKLSSPIMERQMTIEWEGRNNFDMLREIIRRTDVFYADLFWMHPEKRPLVLKLNDKIILETSFPIAIDSNDHKYPESTIEGTCRHPRFVNRVEQLFPSATINFLDLACGGGGLVFDFAKRKHNAFGLDGSDYCKNSEIGFWPILHENLFTCDITKPFYLKQKEDKVIEKFHIITMYEVFEHIPEVGLEQLLQNIINHLSPNGYFLGSISFLEYRDEERNIDYHVTVKPKEWWVEKFSENGLVVLEKHPFDFDDFYRGVGRGYQDPHNYERNPNAGMHFVARVK